MLVEQANSLAIWPTTCCYKFTRFVISLMQGGCQVVSARKFPSCFAIGIAVSIGTPAGVRLEIQ